MEDLRAAYRSVFNGPDGLKVLRDLFVFCGGLQLSYVRGNIYETVFNEGMRNVLLRILNMLEIYNLETLEDKLHGRGSGPTVMVGQPAGGSEE